MIQDAEKDGVARLAKEMGIFHFRRFMYEKNDFDKKFLESFLGRSYSDIQKVIQEMQLLHLFIQMEVKKKQLASVLMWHQQAQAI